MFRTDEYRGLTRHVGMSPAPATHVGGRHAEMRADRLHHGVAAGGDAFATSPSGAKQRQAARVHTPKSGWSGLPQIFLDHAEDVEAGDGSDELAVFDDGEAAEDVL